MYYGFVFVFFKQKAAYEMRISDWSSDVCSSDLHPVRRCASASSNWMKRGKRASAPASPLLVLWWRRAVAAGPYCCVTSEKVHRIIAAIAIIDRKSVV